MPLTPPRISLRLCGETLLFAVTHAMTTTNTEDETAITEITIQPDGRIFVFGLSLEVAQVLEGLCPAGHAIGRMVAAFENKAEVDQPAKQNENAIGLTESER
jgi:hypothetical protein